MELADTQVTITGGAGLIGPFLARRLLPEADVRVVDDLSKGDRDRVPEGATFHEADVADRAAVADAIDPETDLVFHLAALTDTNYDDDRELFERNTRMTHNVVERARDVDAALAFTSSSTVYGEAPRPTPEDYAPLEPISVYGSAKLADEALLSTFAHSYGVQTWVFRFANIVGPGQRGTVIPDFVQKLRRDPTGLEILGDGRQQKSYLHAEDCADAMVHVVREADDAFNVYNLGSRTTTSVTRIADIVSEEMGLDPTYSFTGGERGWTGDVPRMRLSVEKLAALGWEAPGSSDDAVRRAAGELIDELTE